MVKPSVGGTDARDAHSGVLLGPAALAVLHHRRHTAARAEADRGSWLWIRRIRPHLQVQKELHQCADQRERVQQLLRVEAARPGLRVR